MQMKTFSALSLSNDERHHAVLKFWFCERDDLATYGQRHAKWFKKSDAFDEEIRQQFLPLYGDAAEGRLAHWYVTPDSCLALIVLLDQFPRNLFRASARAFATDTSARHAARHALTHSFDRHMMPVERQFIYLPMEHSESLRDQERCVQLMRDLSAFPETSGLHEWAEKHHAIIARFGRFPHRNAALGRVSTAEEIAFMQEPNSSF